MPTLTIVVIKIISFKIGKVAELLSLSIGLMKDILGRKNSPKNHLNELNLEFAYCQTWLLQIRLQQTPCRSL
jgi:hypothetical protein